MKDLLDHPWIKVLVVATTIAMCSFALRETASITQPVVAALGEVLVPVAVAFAIAYVVTPVVDAVARLGLNRTLAAGMLFGLGSLLLVGALALLVPLVVRQSAELSVQLFRGESYVDRNQNGRFDPGEPFEDLNRNSQRDPPLLSRFATFLEESQSNLRVSFGLGIGEQSLSFVALYEGDTRELRLWLEQMVTAARQGKDASEWPAMPANIPPADPALAWSPAWPGPLAKDLDEVQPYLPPADRNAWQTAMARVGQELFHRHAGWLSAFSRAKEGKAPAGGDDDQVTRIRQGWSHRLDVEERKVASAYALELERLAKDGQTAARDVLTSAGVSPNGEVGGATISAAVTQIEDSLRGSVDDLPTRLGAWAKAGLGSYESFFAFAIGVLLIPLYAFFLLLGMPRIRGFIKDYLPARHKDKVIGITREIEKVVAAFFRGRLIICTICSLVGCLGFLTIGWLGVTVPYGLLWGLGIGLATAIPLAGILFLIPAVALTMIQPGAGMSDLMAVVAVYAVVQGLEACLIPLIMGRKVELHPVTLIVALLLCGKLLGVLGLILAVPIAASFRILLREFFWPRLKMWADTGRWKAAE